jgi:hypothetical protein
MQETPGMSWKSLNNSPLINDRFLPNFSDEIIERLGEVDSTYTSHPGSNLGRDTGSGWCVSCPSSVSPAKCLESTSMTYHKYFSLRYSQILIGNEVFIFNHSCMTNANEKALLSKTEITDKRPKGGLQKPLRKSSGEMKFWSAHSAPVLVLLFDNAF